MSSSNGYLSTSSRQVLQRPLNNYPTGNGNSLSSSSGTLSRMNDTDAGNTNALQGNGSDDVPTRSVSQLINQWEEKSVKSMSLSKSESYLTGERRKSTVTVNGKVLNWNDISQTAAADSASISASDSYNALSPTATVDRTANSNANILTKSSSNTPATPLRAGRYPIASAEEISSAPSLAATSSRSLSIETAPLASQDSSSQYVYGSAQQVHPPVVCRYLPQERIVPRSPLAAVKPMPDTQERKTSLILSNLPPTIDSDISNSASVEEVKDEVALKVCLMIITYFQHQYNTYS